MALPEMKLELPSNGLIYELREVAVRSWTVAEEKILFSSTSDAVDRVMAKCVVYPNNFQVGMLDDLILEDKMYMLFGLRMVSLGEIYSVSVRCPHCGEINHKDINMSELPVNYLDEELLAKRFVEIASGDVLELRFLTGRDTRAVQDKAKRDKKRFREMEGDSAYIHALCARIAKINEEEVSDADKQRYVLELSAKDSDVIYNAINELSLGIDLTVYDACSSCGQDLEVMLPIGASFFRPSSK